MERTAAAVYFNVRLMETLDWLQQRRLQSVLHREHDWVFGFDGQATLVVECLWRLLEGGRIHLTSLDDGQQFGLPVPVAAADEASRRLSGALIESVELRSGTLDLTLRFDTGHTLEFIPDSSGYESWHAFDGGQEYHAVGGGNLTVSDGGRAE